MATAEEQKVLVKYRGWGGLKNVFHGYVRTSVKRRDELKKHLPKDEYATAARSILNAHYTAPEVIKAMWSAAEHLGFSGGQVLEPASGVGHFLGMVPGSVAAKTKFTTVEMDATSAEITRQLYQRENVKHSRYEEVTLPESFYDLVITNVPFADVRPTDRKYNKSRMFLHDYYISKSLQLTRPGGIVMAISSKGTMDKLDSRSREVISKHGDLVGAFRLPEDAFKQNAGTTVTTDVLIFRRKVEGQEFAGAKPWIETETVKMKIAADVYGAEPKGYINEYYVANPKMLLGEMLIRRGRYGGGEETSMVKEPGTDVPAMMTARTKALPLDVLMQPVETPGQVQKQTMKAQYDEILAIPDGAITEIDGKLARRIGEKLDVLPETTPKQVHPRACGEQNRRNVIGNRSTGSSPRLRGTASCVSLETSHGRFIPAPAGNRLRLSAHPVIRAVHPRACGEQGLIRCELVPVQGSSPRLRGTVPPAGQATPRFRFIPAPAGNS